MERGRVLAALKRSLASAAHGVGRGPSGKWLLARLEAEGMASMARVLEAGALDDGQGYELDYGLDRIIAGIGAGSRPGALAARH